ncbi:MAG: hypothetical protein ACLR7Z_02595 [Bilophila wadsworthia]
MSLYLRNATWIDPETFKATTTTIKVEEGPSGGMALDAHAPVECPPEDTVLTARAASSRPPSAAGTTISTRPSHAVCLPHPRRRRTSLRCSNTSGGAWTSSITT